MEPKDILAQARQSIEEHAGGDPDKWWYANRFVFARLMLDERKTKTAIKKALLEADGPCHFCGKVFTQKKGVHLHRLDQSKAYRDGNCVLSHKQCHEEHHQEQLRKGDGRGKAAEDPSPVLTKKSKRYDGAFLYWWDISPALAAKLEQHEAVEFICSDNRASCLVPVASIKPLLTPERQTSRGKGHWGVKVRKYREDELAIEAGRGGGDWVYLPVTWTELEDAD